MRVWTKRPPDNRKQRKLLSEYDCSEQRYRLLHLTDHGWDGENVAGDVPEPKWAYAVPDTFGHNLLLTICSGMGGKGYGPVRKPVSQAPTILTLLVRAEQAER